MHISTGAHRISVIHPFAFCLLLLSLFGPMANAQPTETEEFHKKEIDKKQRHESDKDAQFNETRTSKRATHRAATEFWGKTNRHHRSAKTQNAAVAAKVHLEGPPTKSHKPGKLEPKDKGSHKESHDDGNDAQSPPTPPECDNAASPAEQKKCKKARGAMQSGKQKTQK